METTCGMCRRGRSQAGAIIACATCGVMVCPDCCEEHVSGHAIDAALLARDGVNRGRDRELRHGYSGVEVRDAGT